MPAFIPINGPKDANEQIQKLLKEIERRLLSSKSFVVTYDPKMQSYSFDQLAREQGTIMIEVDGYKQKDLPSNSRYEWTSQKEELVPLTATASPEKINLNIPDLCVSDRYLWLHEGDELLLRLPVDAAFLQSNQVSIELAKTVPGTTKTLNQYKISCRKETSYPPTSSAAVGSVPAADSVAPRSGNRGNNSLADARSDVRSQEQEVKPSIQHIPPYVRKDSDPPVGPVKYWDILNAPFFVPPIKEDFLGEVKNPSPTFVDWIPPSPVFKAAHCGVAGCTVCANMGLKEKEMEIKTIPVPDVSSSWSYVSPKITLASSPTPEEIFAKKFGCTVNQAGKILSSQISDNALRELFQIPQALDAYGPRPIRECCTNPEQYLTGLLNMYRPYYLHEIEKKVKEAEVKTTPA